MPKDTQKRDGLLAPTPNHGRCPNCDASMMEYIFKVDLMQVILLIAMAKEVRRRMHEDKLDFTRANQIHVPSLITITHGTKCRTTQASKLGLVAKLHGKGSQGVWAITHRGWQGLAGQPIPAMVKVFRNRIEARFEDTITFEEAKRIHIESVHSAILRHKDPKRDYRLDLEGYCSEEWYDYAGVHQPENQV